MRKATIYMTVLASAVAVAGCAADVTESDGYRALEQELVAAQMDLGDLEEQLAAVIEERDALAEGAAVQANGEEICADAAAARYEKTKATQQAIIDVVADPTSFGTDDDVLDLLDTLAAPGTQFRDDAFGGATGWRSGWRQTLFGGLDADIQTWHRWLADDGSGGGALWSWTGTAGNGESFELIGINLNTYDEEGLVTSQTVYYPYEASRVQSIFATGG